MLDRSCRNLLVRGVNWIGDGVMTLPALRSLRKALPGINISLLVKPWVTPVFEKNPHVDEIISYGEKHRGVIGKLKLSKVLRKGKFCSAILLQNAFDAALIAFLAGIKQRAGYNRDGRGFLLTTAVSLPRNEAATHQIYYYLNLLEHLGIKAEYSLPYVYLTLDERLNARHFLRDMKRPVLGINPGATYGSAKRWFPERFAEVVNWFIQETNGSVIVFGGKSEIDIADEIYKKISPEFRSANAVRDMAGKTPLRELISLISECDAFVTNDSGPMHIAYAVRTPLVSIFGSTNPQLTGPPPGMEGGNVVISPDLPCSPCFERACKNNDMKCMYTITSDEVYYGIKKVLPDTPAVFFDRDGTLCSDAGYINNMRNFQVFSETEDLKVLSKNGFKIIGVTNQSGIARGIVDETFVREVNDIFIEKYGFNDFYHCPHHPDEYCPCRKPEPGMLFRARGRHNIDLKKSYVVGDKETDMLLAKAVGAKGILVQTGKSKESQYADFIAKDLREALSLILRKSR
jgi:heptosyltransferase-2